jgi:hypothetical protein
MASLTTAMFWGVCTVFTLPPFFFSVETVASEVSNPGLDGMGRQNNTIAMNSELSSKFTLSNRKTVTVFCKTLSRQKHAVLQFTAPL